MARILAITDMRKRFYLYRRGQQWYAEDASQLATARQQLVAAQLVAYQKPLYQVLALPEPASKGAPPTGSRSGQVQSVADILRQALAGGPRP